MFKLHLPPPPHYISRLLTHFGCLIVLLSCNIFYSCSDSESDITAENIQNVESRSSSHDKEWAIDFQDHLQNLHYNNPTTKAYSLSESMDGLEWLFNYTYTQSQEGVVEFKTQGYNYSVDDFDLLQFYNTVEN